MIDDKKLKEACIASLNESVYNNYMHTCPYVEGFYAGSKWTSNELLKDHWHPYDEEPRNHSNIIYLNADGDIRSKQYIKGNWRDFVCFFSVCKWAYKDDLLAKEDKDEK